MEGLNAVMAWFVANEAALSGVAATVVILGFVASPLGAGLRRLVGRQALLLPKVAAPPAADILAPPEPEADRPSIAVLPFVPVSKDEDSEIFADGMTDDIITALGHVHGFFVISSTSTFAYKGQSVDTRLIGRDLGVRYVVEGRVQRSREMIRVNAKLVETRTGEQIWAERFEGDTANIFALQEEITRSVVGQLQPELLQAEWRRGGSASTDNVDAWTLVHTPRIAVFGGYTETTLKEARRLSEAALEKNPN